tara:strand:- start:947 stop:1189 length:243 start_codon:yes stop_codon:yes gene_type:complete
MFCYREGDLVSIPQSTWLFNEESLHKGLLFPKKVVKEPSIACVVSSEKDGSLLKVFIKNEYFLVKSKDVHFASRMVCDAC